MDNIEIKGGDNVIIIDSTWKSVIGKSAIVCDINDSTDPEKLKVDFENGFVGYFTQEQLSLDNDLSNPDNILRHLKYMLETDISSLEEYQIQNMISGLTGTLDEYRKIVDVNHTLTQKVIELENQIIHD